MTRLHSVFLVTALGLLLLACADASAPSRGGRYDWRIFVPFDSAGPRVDTLTFHWTAAQLPVRVWAQDTLATPQHVQDAIDRWKSAFLYGEFDAVLVPDSGRADLIVRVQPLSGNGIPALLGACEAETEIETGNTRRELRVPIHISLHPKADPSVVDPAPCLDIVATHELGHAMGIFQHSDDPLDLMFAQPDVNTPSMRDIHTIETIYHLPSNMVPVRQ
jgi:predicted Zn-dependent protease